MFPQRTSHLRTNAQKRMKIGFALEFVLGAAAFTLQITCQAQNDQRQAEKKPEPPRAFTIPHSWTRHGLILERQKDGNGSGVSGDPCIVWDDAINGWRMVFFHDPPGHAQAICLTRDDVGPGQW